MVEKEADTLYNRLSSDDIKRQYEEWMKIAVNNKINASNSWNIGLIDYLHDMTISKDGVSINFTRASCTLEACVKIYIRRVKSLEEGVRKLCSALVDSNTNTTTGDEENEENETEINQAKKSSRKARRNGRTLETNINALNVNKFDCELMVDPIFKKTSADFDEGGARGLLLNNLPISSTGHMILDASDSKIEESDKSNPFESTRINILKLNSKFGEIFSTIWERESCPSFTKFELFSTDATSTTLPFDASTLFPNKNPMMSNGSDILADVNVNSDNMDDNDDDDPFASYNDAPQGQFGGDYSAEDFLGGGGEMDVRECTGDCYENIQEQVHRNDFVKEASGGTYCTASNEVEENGLFSYFNVQMPKTWAGPGHWRKKSIATAPVATSKKKARKSPFIDFINGTPPNLNELFKPSAASTILSKSAWANTVKTKNLLPDDLHYSSKDLLQLFLKPNCMIKFRRMDDRSVKIDADVECDHGLDDEINPFTLVNEEKHADGNLGEYPDDPFGFDDDDDDIDDVMMGTQPFKTDGGKPLAGPTSDRRFSMAGSVMGEEDYGSQLVEQPKKVKIIPLEYARAAKRVDVRALKRNIWMRLVRSTLKPQDESPLIEEGSAIPPSRRQSIMMNEQVSEQRHFSHVVHELKDVYPERKLKDISPSFCFICLLHLANENHLKIEGQPDLKDVVIMQE